MNTLFIIDSKLTKTARYLFIIIASSVEILIALFDIRKKNISFIFVSRKGGGVLMAAFSLPQLKSNLIYIHYHYVIISFMQHV